MITAPGLPQRHDHGWARRALGGVGGLGGLRGGAEGALAGGRRDRGQALRAVLRRDRLFGGWLVALHQRIPRHHDEEIDDGGQDHEGDEEVDEVAVEEVRSVHCEVQAVEVPLAPDRSEQRRDEVADECCYQGPERRTDDDCDGKVDDIAAEQELPKTTHVGTSGRHLGRLGRRYAVATTPGLRIPAGSTARFAAANALANGAGRCAAYQGWWSRPAAWWCVIVPPAASTASLAAAFTSSHCASSLPRRAGAMTVKYGAAPSG